MCACDLQLAQLASISCTNTFTHMHANTPYTLKCPPSVPQHFSIHSFTLYIELHLNWITLNRSYNFNTNELILNVHRPNTKNDEIKNDRKNEEKTIEEVRRENEVVHNFIDWNVGVCNFSFVHFLFNKKRNLLHFAMQNFRQPQNWLACKCTRCYKSWAQTTIQMQIFHTIRNLIN